MRRPIANRQRGVVFDLDDSLYLERDYVLSGFRAVAHAISSRVGASNDELFEYLNALFTRGERGNSFDRLRLQYPEIAAAFSIEDLVRIYREHEPDISLAAGVGALLDDLAERGTRRAVITDGPEISQRRKLDALRLLDSRIETAILTDRWGREYWKPHPRAFEEVARQWRLAPSQLVYIGDNPAKDFVTPRRLGWHTIRLRFAGQQHSSVEPTTADHAAHAEVEDFGSLAGALEASRTNSST
jgi:putative hydrolase of the HAD superfamily